MSAAAQRIGAVLLFLFSFLAPWEVYTYVPGMDMSGIDLLMWALVTVLALDVGASRQLRVPFELLWPIAALATALLAACEQIAGAWAPIALYVAVLHFIRSRARVEQCLALFTAAAAGVALCSIAAGAGILFPTVYSLGGRAIAAGPSNSASATFLLAAGTGLAVHFITQRPTDSRGRGPQVFGVCCLFPLVAALFVHAPQAAFSIDWQTPPLHEIGIVRTIAFLSLLWLTSRIAAKSAVAISAARAEGSRFDNETVSQTCLAALVFGGAALCLCLSLEPGVVQALLLGLASAYALPDKERAKPQPRRAYALLAPCALLVCVNAWHVFPGNADDPRNYAAAARTACQARQFDYVERKMEIIERLSPDERQSHFWRASAALGLGLPHYAAYEFAAAREPAHGVRLLLPPPDPSMCEDFLVRLRDACSSSPQPRRLLAFEYALAAAGKPQQTLASLRHRVQRASQTAAPMPSAPLARTIAFLLGDAALAEPLAAWSAGDLLGLLEQWGALTETAPAEFPADHLPLVLAARATREGIQYHCETAVDETIEHAIPAPMLFNKTQSATGWQKGGWSHLEYRGEGWRATLRMPSGATAAEICLFPAGGLTDSSTPPAPEFVPDTPCIRVLIPAPPSF